MSWSGPGSFALDRMSRSRVPSGLIFGREEDAGRVTSPSTLRLRLCASVSFQPVFFRLHLRESRHRPLEGKPFLLAAEDGQTAGFVLFHGGRKKKV